MESVSGEAIRGDAQRLEAMVEEGVAEARAHGLGWVEVYLRHWRLQRRVLADLNVSGNTLTEAISLYEFANRDAQRDCPQSVCAAQDLCEALNWQDGPGNAEHCLAASEETLSRITPELACYQCVGAARCSALEHAGRHDEAFKLATEARRRIGSRTFDNFALRACESAIELGEYERALSLAKISESPNSGLAPETRPLRRARALAELGRVDEALAEMPGFGQYKNVNAAYFLLVLTRLGARSLEFLDATGVESFASQRGRSVFLTGAMYESTRIAVYAAELARIREAPIACAHHVSVARARCERLKKPEQFEGQLQDLARWAQSAASPPRPWRDALRAASGQSVAEASEILEAALPGAPAEAELLCAVLETRVTLGRADAAIGLAQELVQIDPLRYRERLLGVLRAFDQHDAVSALLLSSPAERDPHWALARAKNFREGGEPARALAELDAVGALSTEGAQLRVELWLETGNVDAAVAALEQERSGSDEALIHAMEYSLAAGSPSPRVLQLARARGRWPNVGDEVLVELFPAVADAHHPDSILLRAEVLNEREAKVCLDPNWWSLALQGRRLRLKAYSGSGASASYLADWPLEPACYVAEVNGVGGPEVIETLRSFLSESGAVYVLLDQGPEASAEGAERRFTLLLSDPRAEAPTHLNDLIHQAAKASSACLFWPTLAEDAGDYETADDQYDALAARGIVFELAPDDARGRTPAS
jgi:hypothetical protein